MKTDEFCVIVGLLFLILGHVQSGKGRQYATPMLIIVGAFFLIVSIFTLISSKW